jgi:hypothetical protein
MSQIILGQQTEGRAYFCPKCNSPVQINSHLGLVGARLPVHCESCGWDGDQSELAQSFFKHEFKSEEEITRAMVADLRNLLAKSSAVIYGAFLLKWGFMDKSIKAVELGRYLMNIAAATVNSVVETRKELLKEAANAGRH